MPFSCADSEKFYELNRYLGQRDEVSEEIDTNALDAIDERESQLRISDRRQSLRSTAIPSTTTSTTTTIRPSTTQRREPPRVPIYRRTSTKRLYHTTLPSTTAAPETVATTQEYKTPTNSAFEFTETTQRSTNIDDSTDRTSLYDDLVETTGFLSAGTPSGTTFEDFVSTARIVPDLIEVGENNEKSIDRTEAKITDDVIQNIKHLQNILPVSARIQENIQRLQAPMTSTPTAIEDQRHKRFLFTADAIENRRRLFNRLNSNKY